MPKLTRYLQKLFAGNSNQIGVFGSGINKQTSTNVETLQSADYDVGWSAAIVTNKNYPIWQEMDGVQYGFSYQLAYLMQNGIPEWLNTETYYTNSFCRIGSDIYYSLQDNNIGHNPALNDGYWKLYNGDNLFKNQTSNCILEMPSTSPSYNNLTITIPAGLKVLIPNGRNADGTLNNIEYTLTSSVTETAQLGANGYWLIFLQPNNSLWFIPKSHINNREGYVYFDFKDNTWYNTYNGQVASTMCLIGEFSTNATEVTSLTMYNGLRLLNHNDKRSILSWSLPNNYGLALTLGANETTYTAPMNGWFSVSGYLANAYQLNIKVGNLYFAGTRSASGSSATGCIVSAPCPAGGKVTIGWGGSSAPQYVNFYFVPAYGETGYM